MLDEIAALQAQLAQHSLRLNALNRQVADANKLSVYQHYADLDWQDWARQIDQWQGEKNALETSQDVLRSLQQQLETLEKSMLQTEETLDLSKREESRRSRDLSMQRGIG